MSLRDKYSQAILTAKNLRMQGNAEVHDEKLHFKGTVNSEKEANQIWDAIKTVPDWQREVVADIKVNAPAQGSGTQTVGTRSESQMTTYTVQAGDTLSKIAKDHLGNANAYMKIFDANKDQLSDPDKIKPGQVLRIP